MANNIIAGIPNKLRALLVLPDGDIDDGSVPVASLFDISNTQKIFQYNPNGLSWTPGPGIKPFTKIFPGVAYDVFSLESRDLTAYFIPPIPTGGDQYSDPQDFTPPTDGQVDFVFDSFEGHNPPSDATDYRMLINGSYNTHNVSGFTISVGPLVGSQRTITISPAVSRADGVAGEFKI